MPELPEVEVLARHLAPLVKGKRIRAVEVRRARVLGTVSPRTLARRLRGAKFTSLRRRGKYLLFQLAGPGKSRDLVVVGHLGMTGRMYLLPRNAPLPKHAAV